MRQMSALIVFIFDARRDCAIYFILFDFIITSF